MRVKYNDQPKKLKFDIVKAAIEEDMTGRVDYNYADMEELFFKKTQLSTCRQGDILPRGKQKLVHQKGVVATVKLVMPEDDDAGIAEERANPEYKHYTGLYAEGAQYGFVRLSESGFLLSDDRTQEEKNQQVYSPSAALKFMIENERSANLLTQVTFEGLNDPYFFAEDFTNHPRILKEGGNQCRF